MDPKRRFLLETIIFRFCVPSLVFRHGSIDMHIYIYCDYFLVPAFEKNNPKPALEDPNAKDEKSIYPP